MQGALVANKYMSLAEAFVTGRSKSKCSHACIFDVLIFAVHA